MTLTLRCGTRKLHVQNAPSEVRDFFVTEVWRVGRSQAEARRAQQRKVKSACMDFCAPLSPGRKYGGWGCLLRWCDRLLLL